MKDINEVIRNKQLLRDELVRQIDILREALKIVREHDSTGNPAPPLPVQVPVQLHPQPQPKPQSKPQPATGTGTASEKGIKDWP